MTEKSGVKSGKRAGTFTGKGDSRNGRGPAKGAPNAGRPPSEIVVLARTIAKRDKLLEIAAMIANREIQEVLVRDKKTGEPIVSDTKNSDRLAAIKLILAYGYGAPVQPVDHDGEVPHEDALDQLR